MQILLEGLIDYQGHSSSGACVVLNNFVKQRGSSLSEQVIVWTLSVAMALMFMYKCFNIIKFYDDYTYNVF